jgi:hypothetical protein
MNALTVLAGMAKPIPTLPPSAPLALPVSIWELTPMTLPSASSSGPPELPGLSAASVWMAPEIVAPSGACRSRFSAETMPVVKVWSRPYGLPIA